ncbi:hypothetical protein MNB_SM-7-1322 [hydrothermal vent metagenome]|uniref:Uncharacterized protein n=1 Tax=hydrothermal vent metagenome TaxID=652676 RepID=A0A1W1BXQ8_9ZZZZ
MKDEKILPVVIHDDILSKIYNYYKDKGRNDTGLAYGVYTFLYKTARIQKNIRVYASDSFIREGVGLGRDKLLQIKRDLRELGLIETIRPRDKNGHFTKEFYIEVKYIWGDEAMNKLFYQEATDTTLYKIARELLKQNFDEYEPIKAPRDYEFEISLNGRETIIVADEFYIENDLLKCTAYIDSSENVIDYTVPAERVGEIMKELASNYRFNFEAVSKVLMMDSKEAENP